MKPFRAIIRLAPFWLFILLFKFGGVMHFTPLAPLGERMFDTWIVGFLIGGASFLQLLLDVPAGLLLDRFGYIRMIRAGTFVFIISCLLLVFVPGPVGFVLSLFLASFGWVFYAPGINAYLLSTAPKEHAEKFMALRDVFDASGVFLSAMI
ncbi:MAG: MFS transporter, partial [Candidatus Colwellbacteria bacterium]|nr:MFS transporter [Candidatus Colwellbacteria bacterium]